MYVFLVLVVFLSIFTQGAVKITLHPRPKSLGASGMILRNRDLVEYFGRMQIGLPAQSFDVIFDTSLDWTWLPTNYCQDCHYCPKYYPYQSNTYKDLNKKIVFKYSIGELEGYIKGDLSLDGITIDKRTIPNQHFLGVVDEAQLFNEYRSSGFVGMSKKNDPDNPSFMMNLRKLNLIESNVFAIKLSSAPNDEGSEISFGEYNQDVIGSNGITWEKSPTNDRWMVNTQYMMFGDERIELTKKTAELVTSEINLRMVRTDFDKIENYLRKKFTCTFDTKFLFYCYVNDKSLKNFPKIEIALSAAKLVLEPKDYVVFGEEKNTAKKIAILQIEVYPSFALENTVIGTVALRNYYVIYDGDRSLIGFAELAKKVEPEGISGGLIAFIIILILIILGAAGFLIYRKRTFGYWLMKPKMEVVKEKPLLANATL